MLLISDLRVDARAASQIISNKQIQFCDFSDNRMDGVDLLDITKELSRQIERYKPDILFTHHHGDLNIDHRRVCEAVLTACRPVENRFVREIYAFETSSSTEWNYTYGEPFKPNVYVDISDAIEAKIQGMACYQSESREYPHPRSGEALISLARYRGSQAAMKYAEGFMLLREYLEIR